MLYVLGKHFDLAGRTKARNFEILVPGNYTIESFDLVYLDGMTHHPAEIVYLQQGKHTISSKQKQKNVTLRWGKQLFRPQRQPPVTAPFYRW